MTHVNHVIDELNRLTMERYAWANASHRAGRAPHQANLCCLGHSATIDFRGGPAVEWLSERLDLAKQLNEESTREGGLAQAPASNSDER